jgi:hypothetical protein
VKGPILLMRVSLPLTVEHGRIRVALAALCAVAALAVLATFAPSAAHAAFTLEKCQGSEITGEGSSLQKLAQANWKEQIFDTTIYEGCGASAPKVTFTTASSGCGLDAMGAGTPASSCTFPGTTKQSEWEKPGYRNEAISFGAADFAPDPTEETNINNGPSGAGQPGSGEVHVIPVAGAAITAVVHFPNGCALQNPEQGGGNGDTSTGGANDPAGAPTGDKFSNATLRVHISDQELEEVWQGRITTWGEIVPEADFLSGTTNSQAACAAAPIYRIVREDTSGTTYNFKHFLALLPSSNNSETGAKLWTSSTSTVGSTNTAWPVGSEEEAPRTVEPLTLEELKGEPAKTPSTPNPEANKCNATISSNHICRSFEGSGGSLSNAVAATSGSIGYLDLATAREKGYNMTPNTSGLEANNDHLYWIPLEAVEPPAMESGVGKVDPKVFVEPTAKAEAHGGGSNETKGANCFGADYRGIPSKASSPNEDPTLADWSKAIATGGTKEAIEKAPTTAYPVCAITYDLAFDDDAAAYKNTPEEEARARTVKDYLTSVVSSTGQGDLPEFDYAALPLEIVHDAEKGVEAIGWNKTAGTGGGGGSTPVTPPSSGGGSTTTTTTTSVVTPPSNAFSIASAKVKGKDIVLSLVLPDAGKVSIKASGSGVTVSSVSASVAGGQGTVTLPISSAALKKLAKAKSKKLSVSITVTFTPNGGTAATQTKGLTITQASIATKKPAKKKSKKKGKKKG